MQSVDPTFADHEDEQAPRRWEWLLLPLALLVSVICVSSATYLPLWIRPSQVVQADMLAQEDANYGDTAESAGFARVDPSIINDATADAAGLLITPAIDSLEPVNEDMPIAITPGPALPAAIPRTTEEASPTAAASPTPTVTAVATNTNTPVVATNTAEATATATNQPTQPPTLVPSATGTDTPTMTPTDTPTPPPTEAPSPTGTTPPTNTPPATNTPKPTNTRRPTGTPPPPPPPATVTPMATATNTATATSTAAATPTPTLTPTLTPTYTPSPTGTPTPSPTAAPVPVRGIAECVQDNGDGTFTAYFGYQNDNASAVSVPIGSDNRFNPAPADRGQPTTFQPGRIVAAFSVTANNNITLVWRLQGGTVTAGSGGPVCATPTPTPP